MYVLRTVLDTGARNYAVDPVFAKTSPKRSFSMTEYERFGLVFTKTRVYKFGHWTLSLLVCQWIVENTLVRYKASLEISLSSMCSILYFPENTVLQLNKNLEQPECTSATLFTSRTEPSLGRPPTLFSALWSWRRMPEPEFKEPKNRFQGANSARLCSLAGRYFNPFLLGS